MFCSYSDASGSSRREEGFSLKLDNKNETLKVKGLYTYSYNGRLQTVTYKADENGFKSQISVSEVAYSPPVKNISSLCIKTLAGGK